MPLLILEINHHHAPLAIREKFAFSREQALEILQQLISHTDIHEIVLMSTCNRTMIICAGDDSHIVLTALCDIFAISESSLKDHWAVYHEEAVLRHLVRVAAGLDSMVLGEPQIFGQLKDAYELAAQHHAVGKTLHPLFQYTFFLSKKVRTETAIGKDPVSVAFAAVNLAKHIFADLSQCKILMLGAGDTAELATKHFAEFHVKEFFFVNRTLEKAELLAHTYHGSAFELDELATVLSEADIILTATDSASALITHGMLKDSLKSRPKSLLLLDLAVPRNVDPTIANLPDCYLYTIDDLESIVHEGLEQRRDAAKIAEEIIEVEIEQFFRKQKVASYGEVIERFTQNVDKITEQFEQQAQASGSVDDVILLSKKLAKKIQHEALALFKEVDKE